jgi:23S rRNA (adenine-N6)-dimethyltransferase
VSGRQPWGWHRLEPQWAELIVTAAEVRPGELVVELGAGTGSLTVPLLDAGARVIAVELHAQRSANLRRRLAGRDLLVVETDVRAFRLPARPFRVVANPPFALTAAILSMLGSARSLTRADVLLQRAVVRQIEIGARRSARGFAGRRLLDLPRTAFIPRAPVDSSVITLRPRRRNG